MAPDPIVIDSGPSVRGFHFYESFIRCPRLYAQIHHTGIARENAPELLQGSLVHVGVAQWRARLACQQHGGFQWEGETITDITHFAKPLDAVRSVAEKNGALWVQHVDTACRLVVNYARHYANERLEVAFVENEMRLNVHCDRWLDSPFLYTQRGDWTSKDPVGRMRLHDVKTCVRFGAITLRRYALSGQFLGYNVFGRRLWGDKFAGVVVDFVEKTGACRIVRQPWSYPAGAAGRYFTDLAYWERNRRELDGKLERGEIKADDFPGKWSSFACFTIWNKPCPGAHFCSRGSSDHALLRGLPQGGQLGKDEELSGNSAEDKDDGDDGWLDE